jgi:hypothetical protein
MGHRIFLYGKSRNFLEESVLDDGLEKKMRLDLGRFYTSAPSERSHDVMQGTND